MNGLEEPNTTWQAVLSGVIRTGVDYLGWDGYAAVTLLWVVLSAYTIRLDIAAVPIVWAMGLFTGMAFTVAVYLYEEQRGGAGENGDRS